MDWDREFGTGDKPFQGVGSTIQDRWLDRRKADSENRFAMRFGDLLTPSGLQAQNRRSTIPKPLRPTRPESKSLPI